MAAVSLFRGSNMAAVTSCENRELVKIGGPSFAFKDKSICDCAGATRKNL